MNNIELINLACDARKFSYSPYSDYKVGAALLTKSGKVFTGCNIENSAFSPTICAERTAFSKAISEGECEFLKIAVVGGKETINDYASPCGVCRQVMSEFCDSDFEIIVAKSESDYIVYSLSDLLPNNFSNKNLGD